MRIWAEIRTERNVLENDRLKNAQDLIEYIYIALDYKLFWHIPPLFNKKLGIKFMKLSFYIYYFE